MLPLHIFLFYFYNGASYSFKCKMSKNKSYEVGDILLPEASFHLGSWAWEGRLATQGSQGPHPSSSSPVLLLYFLFCKPYRGLVSLNRECLHSWHSRVLSQPPGSLVCSPSASPTPSVWNSSPDGATPLSADHSYSHTSALCMSCVSL